MRFLLVLQPALPVFIHTLVCPMPLCQSTLMMCSVLAQSQACRHASIQLYGISIIVMLVKKQGCNALSTLIKVKKFVSLCMLCSIRPDGVIFWLTLIVETDHVFGFPAVPRSRSDGWKHGVYIPHPHQLLPWKFGSITSWHFYLQVDPGNSINLTLQVWRLKGKLAYMLVGQTRFTALQAGYHEKNLTGSDVIHFQAGDVIGMQFENYNPVPYDMRAPSCASDEKVLYLVQQDMSLDPQLHQGAVYAFEEKPDSWSACRMYSLFAQYSGEGKNDGVITLEKLHLCHKY